MKKAYMKLWFFLSLLVFGGVLSSCRADRSPEPGPASADVDLAWYESFCAPINNEDGPGHNNVNNYHVEFVPPQPGEPEELTELVGDTLLVASALGGLRAVDLSDPDRPRHLGHAHLPGKPLRMTVSDGQVAVSCRTGATFPWSGGGMLDYRMRLLFFDLSAGGELEPGGVLDSAGVIRSFSREGARLTLVETLGDLYPTLRVSTWDVTDPVAPVLLGELALEDNAATDVNVRRPPVLFDGPRLWLQDRYGALRQVALDDPSGAPAAVADVALSHEDARVAWMALDADHLWVLSTHANLTLDVFPITGGLVGERLASVEVPVSGELTAPRFTRDGTRLAFTTDGPVVVVELADPAEPLLWAVVQTGARDLALDGDALLLDVGGRLLPFDIATRNLPVQRNQPLGDVTGAWEGGGLHRLAPGLLAVTLRRPSPNTPEALETGLPGAVALFSHVGTDVRVRGILPHAGYPGDAFFHRGRLVVAGTRRVETADVADPDLPASVAQVPLARAVAAAVALPDNRLALVVDDEFARRVTLELYPDADAWRPSDPPEGTLVFGEPWFFEAIGVFQEQGLFPATLTRLLVLDGALVLVSSFPGPATGWDTRLWRFDVTEPAAPALVATAAFPFGLEGPRWGGCGLTRTEGSFHGGGALASFHPWDDPDLRVVDLGATGDVPDLWSARTQVTWDPDRPVLPHLTVRGDQLWLARSRAEKVHALSARWLVDRLDLRDPARPRWLPTLDAPGKVLDFDPATGRVILIDARWEPAAPDPVLGCRVFRPFSGGVTGDARCVRAAFTLRAARFDGDRLTVTGEAALGGVARGARIVGGRLFVEEHEPRWTVAGDDQYPEYTPVRRLHAFTWEADGALSPAWTRELPGTSSGPALIAASDAGALVLHDGEVRLLHDTSPDLGAATGLPGVCWYPAPSERGFICALGDAGFFQVRP